MKKIILNRNTAPSILGTLKKMITENGSMIFPTVGTENKTSKFGNLRKITSLNPMRLTTHLVQIKLGRNGLIVTNPLNDGFGYSDFTINFGTLIFAYNSFFWKDSHGYWRQMHFSKNPGWALGLSGGRSDIYFKPNMKIEIPSRFPGRVKQFLDGTGDW